MSVEFEAAEALRHVALDETVKSYVLQHPPLYHALRCIVPSQLRCGLCLSLILLG